MVCCGHVRCCASTAGRVTNDVMPEDDPGLFTNLSTIIKLLLRQFLGVGDILRNGTRTQSRSEKSVPSHILSAVLQKSSRPSSMCQITLKTFRTTPIRPQAEDQYTNTGVLALSRGAGRSHTIVRTSALWELHLADSPAMLSPRITISAHAVKFEARLMPD
jgi:hypothetical protein